MNNRQTITLKEALQQAEELLASLSQLEISHMALIERYSIAHSRISSFYHNVNFNDNASLAAFAGGLKGTPFEDIKTRLGFMSILREYSFRINRLNWFIMQTKHLRPIVSDIKMVLDSLPEQHRHQRFIDMYNNINAKLAILDEMLLAMDGVSNPLMALNELQAKEEEMLANEKMLNAAIGSIHDLRRQIIAEKDSIAVQEAYSQSFIGRLSGAASSIFSLFGHSSSRSAAVAPESTLSASSASVSNTPTR